MSEFLRQWLGTRREMKFKTSFHNTVHDVLKARGYRETENDDWDVCWSDKEWIHESLDTLHLMAHQRVNHFRNHYELTRKDLLIKHIKRNRRACERNGMVAEAEA